MVEIQPMLVFCVSYLTIFSLLMIAVPALAPNLLYSGKVYMGFNIPEYFSSADIENIKYFENDTLTFPHNNNVIDFNPDVNVQLFTNWITLEPYINLNHITWELWYGSFPFMSTFDRMYFYSYNTTLDQLDHEYLLGKPELISNWQAKYNSSIFTAKKDDNTLAVKCWFRDTNTTRNDIGDAWDEGSVVLGVGFGFDDVITSYNAFNLIGLLLTFQRPDIFGASGAVAILLNSIIAIPTFLCIAYLIYYFITSIIPFIKGA